MTTPLSSVPTGAAVGTGRAAVDCSIRHVTVHGHRRAYRMAGDGPALLLLHGIGDRSASWLPIMTELARDHTVIAPDLLGHGESDKPRADYSVGGFANGMRDLLELVGVERATVVGHSLGGGVAAQFAYQFPERCERLVLVASGGVGHEVSVLLRIASAPFVEFVAPFLRRPLGRWPWRIALEVLRVVDHDLGCDADEVMRVFDGASDLGAQMAFSRTLRSVVDWRGQVVTMRDRAYLVEGMPVMVVWGGRDAIIPVAHAQLALEAVPRARLEIYSGAGHFPHHHDPLRFVTDLRDFMATTSPVSHEADRWRARLRRRSASPEG